MARHAGLFGQERDLGQVLDDHAEHDIVGHLADAGELAVADIGYAGPGNGFQIGANLIECRFRARRD